MAGRPRLRLHRRWAYNDDPGLGFGSAIFLHLARLTASRLKAVSPWPPATFCDLEPGLAGVMRCAQARQGRRSRRAGAAASVRRPPRRCAPSRRAEADCQQNRRSSPSTVHDAHSARRPCAAGRRASRPASSGADGRRPRRQAELEMRQAAMNARPAFGRRYARFLGLLAGVDLDKQVSAKRRRRRSLRPRRAPAGGDCSSGLDDIDIATHVRLVGLQGPISLSSTRLSADQGQAIGGLLQRFSPVSADRRPRPADLRAQGCCLQTAVRATGCPGRVCPRAPPGLWPRSPTARPRLDWENAGSCIEGQFGEWHVGPLADGAEARASAAPAKEPAADAAFHRSGPHARPRGARPATAAGRGGRYRLEPPTAVERSLALAAICRLARSLVPGWSGCRVGSPPRR